jgi:hypothetical protein
MTVRHIKDGCEGSWSGGFDLRTPTMQSSRFIRNSEGVEVAVCDWWQMQEPDFGETKLFKLVARRGKCVSVDRHYVENNGTSVQSVSCVYRCDDVSSTFNDLTSFRYSIGNAACCICDPYRVGDAV